MRLQHVKRSCGVVFLGLILILSPVFGCGKKTPPRIPEKPGQVVAPPENFQAQVSGTQVTLTWTHAVHPVRAVLVPRYFEVSMAIPADCEGCPFVFKPVGQAVMPETVFEMPLTGTGPWYFRVQAIGDHDIRSEYSKTVVVEALQ
jgi:predicted small lipoprotein YifL